MTDKEEESNGEVPDWATDPEFIHHFWRQVERDVDVDGDCDSPCHIYVGNKSLDEIDIHEYQWTYIPSKYEGGGQSLGSHRAAYCIAQQVPLNTELDVHHHCNIPACVKASAAEQDSEKSHSGHLQRVSRSENIRLAYRDGLATPPDNEGEENGFSELTEDEVFDIHREFHTTEKTTRQIAAEYNIHPSHIRKLVLGDAWPHTYEKICEEIPEDDRRPVTNQGQHNGRADFDPETIRNLFRDRFQRGLTTHQLADRYSTEERYVRRILNRKRWAHVRVDNIPGVPEDINERPKNATSAGPKLTPDSVRSIFRGHFERGLAKEQLAKEYGVSEATIRRALDRNTYNKVDISNIDAVPDELKDQ